MCMLCYRCLYAYSNELKQKRCHKVHAHKNNEIVL